MDSHRLKTRILVVEDEKAIAAFVQAALEREGLNAQIARSGEAALARIEAERPDLILLDLMLPGLDGFEVCRRVRALKPYIPIIMLTARAEDTDKIVGLELGADDYITKPFNARELVARVRALLRLIRHTGGEPAANIIQAGDLAVDRDRHTATVAGQPVDLTPKEFDLLATLIADRGRVFGREMLLERVWGYDYIGESRTVDVHIQRLRQKIESDPANPRYLLTVRGIGYKFAAEEEL
ncbi:MAG: response regulator transcription factor [Anaerolineae bacterium]|nr:response regulator transcription factor [Anaerolineae bacterium]